VEGEKRGRKTRNESIAPVQLRMTTPEAKKAIPGGRRMEKRAGHVPGSCKEEHKVPQMLPEGKLEKKKGGKRVGK